MMGAISALPPEIASRVAQAQESRFAPFDPVALAYLAIVPSWTESAARVCGFPTSSPESDLTSFLRTTEAAQLCIRDAELRPQDDDAEIARTFGALWPALAPIFRLEYRNWFEHAALAMEESEEGIALLIGAKFYDELRGEGTKKLMERIRAVEDRESQARLLAQAALFAANADLFAAAWAASEALCSPLERAQLRTRLFTKAPAFGVTLVRDSLLQEVQTIREPATRASLLVLLFSERPDDQDFRQEVENAVYAVPDTSSRALYLAVMARAYGQGRLSREAIELASSFADASTRARTLLALSLHCRGDAQGEALLLSWNNARDVQDAGERTALLAQVAAHWATVQPDTIIKLAQDVPDVVCRAEVLLACLRAPELRTPGNVALIAKVIEDVPLQNLRNRLLLRLAAQGPYQDMRRALEIARSLSDTIERSNALISLFPRLDESDRPPVIDEIFSELERVSDPSALRTALIQLVPSLDEEHKWKALSLATRMRRDRGFRVNENIRKEMVDYLRGHLGPRRLYMCAWKIGNALTHADNISLPRPTLRWAKLAARLAPDKESRTVLQKVSAAFTGDMPAVSDAGPYLTNQIRELVDSGNTGAALDWLAAGQLLASATGGDVESAVLAGRHRIELAYRRAMDERHLRRYLERREQTQAFLDLLAGPESRWALHFLGAAGVGKTMLLRHIMARLAVKGGQRLACSRVDFDHISPEFPVRKPGQLLAELADELRIYGGSSRLENSFSEFQDRLLALHATLSDAPPAEDPLQNVRSPAFREVVSSFADLLRQLPPPVILILDTCEELSKLEPINARVPSVEATFEILQRLHEELPTIRVVFAGRRLLAQSRDVGPHGPLWWVDTNVLVERNRHLPEYKDYLRLHLIRGFTRGETDDYFNRIAGVYLDVAQRQAVLNGSIEPVHPVPVRWSQAPPESAGPRYNPFDLSLYAEWLREVPDLPVATIESGETDPYVEMRILRRLEDTLCRAVPGVILLRRFDERMLRPIAPDETACATLFRDLQGQEWIDSQRDEDLGTLFVEVNPRLRERIEKYYSRPDKQFESDAMRAVLGPGLERDVLQDLQDAKWFDKFNFSRVEAVLRLLPPAAAGALWSAFDQRITETAEWNWAYKVCPQLLGEGNVAGVSEAPLRAGIRATLTAALLHLQRDFDPTVHWPEILEGSSAYPNPSVAIWLSYRALILLGDDPEPVMEAARRDSSLSKFQLDQIIAAGLARFYDLNLARTSEDEEFDGEHEKPEKKKGANASKKKSKVSDHDDDDDGDDDDLDDHDSNSVLGHLYIASTSEYPEIRMLAELLTGELRDVPEIENPPQRWADWRVPDCLTDRLRLELCVRRKEPHAPTVLASWAAAAIDRLQNIDSECLLSVLLARYPDLFENADLTRITYARFYDPERVELCTAHRAVVPLYRELAIAWSRRGNRQAAADVVSEVRLRMLEARKSVEQLGEVNRLWKELVVEVSVQRMPAKLHVERPLARSVALWLHKLLVIVVSLSIPIFATLGLRYLNAWRTFVKASDWIVGIVAVLVVLRYGLPPYRDFILRIISQMAQPKLVIRREGDAAKLRWNWGHPARQSEGEADRATQSQSVELTLALPRYGRYESEASGLKPLTQQLARIGSVFLGGKFVSQLRVDGNLQSYAWEALIQASLTPSSGKLRERIVRFYRIVDGVLEQQAIELLPWRETNRILLICPAVLGANFQANWEYRLQSGIGLLTFSDANRLQEGDLGLLRDSERVRALHLVGRTRRSGERAFQYGTEAYLRKEQIPAEHFHITIVQCQPVEALERTDTDRELTGAVRAFAAELHEAGALTVIFLPQLPIAVSNRVLARLSKLCTRLFAPSYFDVIKAVTDVRKLIAESVIGLGSRSGEAGEKYAYADAAPAATPEKLDHAALERAGFELSMDVTVWLRLDNNKNTRTVIGHGRLR